MGARARGLAAVWAASVLVAAVAAAGCGGDGDDGGPEADHGCPSSHPTAVDAQPPGYVRACSSPDGRSLWVENVSSHVLRVWASAAPETTTIGLLPPAGTSPGVVAAAYASGSGWDPQGRFFVLPLGHSLTATDDAGRVAIQFAADLERTAVANTARYAAEWVAARLTLPGHALAQRVQSCAASARAVVEGVHFDLVLRSALELPQCAAMFDEVLASPEARSPQVELPRARQEVLALAKPVLRDRLISVAARVYSSVR